MEKKIRTAPLKRRVWMYLGGWGWIISKMPFEQRQKYDELYKAGRKKEAKVLLGKYK